MAKRARSTAAGDGRGGLPTVGRVASTGPADRLKSLASERRDVAEKNISEAEIDRTEAADRLRELADRLDGEEEFDVDVNNKTISLNPSSTIGYEIGVRESSSLLRGSRESVTIKLDWKPKKE